MAADSLIGSVEGYDDLPASTKDAIDSFLNDTQNGDVEITPLDGGTLVTGIGANDEVQSVLIPDGSDDPITATSGGFTITVDGNPQTVLTIEGPDGEQKSSDDYFRSVVDSVVGASPDVDPEALSDSLNTAIDIVTEVGKHGQGRGPHDDRGPGNGRGPDDDRNPGEGRGPDDDRGPGNGRGPDDDDDDHDDDDDDDDHGNGNGHGHGHGKPGTVVKVIQIIDEDTGPITLTGSDDDDEIVMLDLKTDAEVIVEGLDQVIVAGAGTVTISDDDDTVIAADLRDQALTGGDGDDTIVGGGGNDTITGGAGEDVFGFVGGAGGNTTITDFSSGDRLAIDLEQVVMLVDIDTSGGDLTATFADGSSLTLVGVSLEDVTGDLILFHI